MADKIEKTGQAWKEQLTPGQFHLHQLGSTEIRLEMSAANVTPRMDNRVATDDNCAL